MRRLGILVKRELFQLLSFKTLLMGHLIQPVAWLALYSVGMARMISSFTYQGTTIRYLDFVLPGLLALQGFNQFAYILSRVADEKRHGMFRAVLMSGVSPTEYIATKSSISLIIVGLQSAGIMGMSYLFLGVSLGELKTRLGTLVLVALGTVFWANLGASLGTVLCSAERSSLATTLLGLPVVFTGSIFYNSETASGILWILGMVNPLTYYTRALRQSMLVGSVRPIEFLALGGLTGVSFALARRAVGVTDLVTIEK